MPQEGCRVAIDMGRASEDALAVVAIGRNEGPRLLNCIHSILNSAAVIVYVDSGSTDESVTAAAGLGATVVELAADIKFTAARARNAGFRKALEIAPTLKYVQFVDGDCEVVPDWLHKAEHFLDRHPEAAAVSGRRRERYPERSIYNELCDMEWERPPGPARHFGGDVLIRVEAFQRVGGYLDGLIAGEEPELCVRLRGDGWLIYTVDADMTIHDAAMTTFTQWWVRTTRSGYAYAQGAHLHGSGPDRHWVWESTRAWIWSVVPAVSVVAASPLLGLWSGAILLVYPAQIARLYIRATGTPRQRLLESAFNVISRFPELVGQVRFLKDRLRGNDAQLIEYKGLPR